MVERSDQRMERSGHGTKWPKDGTKWFGTKWSWNEVTGYQMQIYDLFVKTRLFKDDTNDFIVKTYSSVILIKTLAKIYY